MRGRARRVARGGWTLAPLLALTLTLAGCETNAQRSARLERRAKQTRRAQHVTGLVITRVNPNVEVLARTVLHGEGGIAAVVALRNSSPAPLRDVPIAITLHDHAGGVLYQNNAPGTSTALVSAPLLLPGQETIWIDDQIPASGTPGALAVKVGDAPTAGGALPQLSVTGAHLFEDPASGVGVEGAVVNHSAIAQQELVVFAIGRRAGRIVAAGRAVLPNAAARSSTTFQIFFIGSPKGAQLQLSAPPTTFG